MLRRHKVVALSVQLDLVDWLAAVFRHQVIEGVAGFENFASVNIDVGRLALEASKRLVNHDARMRQRVAFAFGASVEQKRAHRCSLAHAQGRNIAMQPLHGVVDRQPCADVAARRVDVQHDVFFWIFRIKEQHLRDDDVGYVIVDGRAEENDPVFEQPRENVPAAFAAMGLLNNRWNDEVGGSHPPNVRAKWPLRNSPGWLGAAELAFPSRGIPRHRPLARLTWLDMSVVIRLPSPALPPLPDSQRGRPTGELHYDDVAQDGRLGILGTAPIIGWLWRDLITHLPGAREMQGRGQIPVLTRLIVNTSEAPARVDQAIAADGGFYLARNSAGSHLFLNIGATLFAKGGRLLPLSGPGPEFAVASIFAEHTFTNIFGGPGQRGVTRLNAPGFPEVPSDIYDTTAPALVGEVPADAATLAPLTQDDAYFIAGLDHTDSNQHVNSLVYVRWFIDAALRRMAAVGQNKPMRYARALEIAYRKPCFAGDRISARVALFTPTPVAGDDAAVIGAAGALYRNDDDKPCAYVRIVLR